MTGQPCPALHILRGAMGEDDEGKPIEPQCHRNTWHGPCCHCHATSRSGQ